MSCEQVHGELHLAADMPFIAFQNHVGANKPEPIGDSQKKQE